MACLLQELGSQLEDFKEEVICYAGAEGGQVDIYQWPNGDRVHIWAGDEVSREDLTEICCLSLNSAH